MSQTDSPKIYIPVPLFYIAFFYFSVLAQYLFPISYNLLRGDAAEAVGWIFMGAGIMHVCAAWVQFIKTNNSVTTIKPANNLQTGGVYAFSRNPMYIGFFFIYASSGLIWGNWWTFILMPFLVLIIDFYVVRREEKYLRRKFGQVYKEYKKSVRRWL
ncbi:MAG: isoprenylcysteine carboxylmethyltransferase family protein [Arachidicoccus sp.]|nr:isoprenylcysteine carboxylmethyltransferase family protein [Arachidicoccus sp.]